MRWSPTLGKVGCLESFGTPECLKFNSKAQNTSHWGVLGVIGKVLKRRYWKWPRIGHSDICSLSYGQKKGRRESTSSRRHLEKCDTTLKSFQRDLQLWFRTHPDSNSGRGAMAVQSSGSLAGTLLGFHFGSPNKMCHSNVASATSRREYYMGEGGGFPRVRAVVSLVCPSARGKSQHQRVSQMLN